jgi:hypothetical protein
MKRKDDELIDVTELVLKPTEGKVRKKRKPLSAMTIDERLKSPTMSMRLLGHFMRNYERRWSHPYYLVLNKHESPSLDLKILGDMGEQWGEEVVVELIEEFFVSTDPQVRRSRSYNTRDFQFCAPKLRMSKHGGGDIADKTASNIHEVSKAMGRKP